MSKPTVITLEDVLQTIITDGEPNPHIEIENITLKHFILFVREMVEQDIERSIVLQVLEKPSHWTLELKHYITTGRLPWTEGS